MLFFLRAKIPKMRRTFTIIILKESIVHVKGLTRTVKTRYEYFIIDVKDNLTLLQWTLILKIDLMSQV